MSNWVRFNDSTKRWELSTNQGGAWADLIERPLYELLDFDDIAAPAVSNANECRLYMDSTAKTLMLSENTGVYAAVLSGTPHPLSTKGDLFAYSTLAARLAIGTNSYALIPASAETTGLKWVPFLRAARFNGSGTVDTDRLAWVVDFTDDGTLYTLADSNCRLTVAEAGTYLISIILRNSGAGANANVRFYLRKNEANLLYHDTGASSGGASGAAMCCVDQAAATDYYDAYCPDPAPQSEATAKISIVKLDLP